MKIVSPAPARPWSPGREGRAVLIAEAPPLLRDGESAGGFWRLDVADALRENLFDLFQQAERTFERFLADGFFLIHTIKWPMVGDDGKATNYGGLHPRETRRELLGHAVTAHIGPELALLKPRGILAMGDAARGACSRFPGGSQVVRGLLGDHRGVDYVISLGEIEVPLRLTLLPVDRNMNVPKKRAMIRDDFAAFVAAHGEGEPVRK